MRAANAAIPPCHPHALLAVPPFPGSRPLSFGGSASTDTTVGNAELDALIARVRELKVIGTYWAAQPPLPDSPYVLVKIRDPAKRAQCVREASSSGTVVSWIEPGWPSSPKGSPAHHIIGSCDPWHMLSGATQLIVDGDGDLALIAVLLGIGTRTSATGHDGDLGSDHLRDCFRALAAVDYHDPFTGEPIDFAAAVELSGFWRKLVDSNRGIAVAIGFAFWKRPTVSPLLWAGGPHVRFASEIRSLRRGERIAIWKSRAEPSVLRSIEKRGTELTEIEDGFIRSVGLGADCVPPLSVVVDRVGIYFDPSRPSELEQLLQAGDFPPSTMERARALRELIVELGISKYSVGGIPLQRRADGKRHLLVVGQVEDDRAMMAGLGPSTNLELLRRVRAANPDAHIVYKPHPDVEARHRTGAIPEEAALSLASELVRHAPMSSLIDVVDEVHVNTSLAGFEALLRHKPVTTYGVPFYAGWGLTRDLGPVPKRRTARRSLDELVAAALLLYPRYLDPVSGLPCPPEILVRRLAEGSTPTPGLVVRLRRLQGHFNRGLAFVSGWSR